MTRILLLPLALGLLAAAFALLVAVGSSAAAPVLAVLAGAGLHAHHRACLPRERAPRPMPVRRG